MTQSSQCIYLHATLDALLTAILVSLKTISAQSLIQLNGQVVQKATCVA